MWSYFLLLFRLCFYVDHGKSEMGYLRLYLVVDETAMALLTLYGNLYQRVGPTRTDLPDLTGRPIIYLEKKFAV